jgi:hypothetical protein
MYRKRLTSMFAIAACGVMLAGAGVAAALTAAPVARAWADVPAARAATEALASGGNVFFTAYQNDDLPGATVVLSGAIADFGAAVSVLRNGVVDPEHSSELNLALTKGTFRLVIGPLHLKLLNALINAPYSLSTCSGHVAAVTGMAPVVAGSGTDAYSGIRGSFKLTITANEVDAKPGCQPFSGSALLAQSIFITGSGTVSFGR